MSKNTMGGKRKGAGRHPGIPNKANAAREAKIAAEGPTPLDVMLADMRFHYSQAAQIQRDKPEDTAALGLHLKNAREAAKDAAPYVHPKRVAIGGDKDSDTPITIRFESLTDAQLDQFIGRLEVRRAAGRR